MKIVTEIIARVKKVGIFFRTHKKLDFSLIASTIIVILFLDYYDFGIAIGWGIFSIQFKPNPIEGVTALFLLLTLYFSWKSTRESLRQTEITMRPYMRLSWDATQIGDNRRAQGITDTCIVVSNDGNGLMRSVKYNVAVDGVNVGVRNHSLIVSKGSTNMVYNDHTNSAGSLLGCRNDNDFLDRNNQIIRNSKILISGSYRDIEGGKYSFSFESDTGEQSNFHEKYRQTPSNR